MVSLDRHATPEEVARTEDLLRLVPTGLNSVLDVGARDGHFSRPLTDMFRHVTALDLERPSFDIPGVETVKGDVTALPYPDSSFDCVFCAEVLEHVPGVEQACREILRVARREIVIGVPFRQDLRVGRTTCQMCGKHNPPWGHVNSFDQGKLERLFHPARVRQVSFVSSTTSGTNPVSTLLSDMAGNPWGTYDQLEPCVHCGNALRRPSGDQLWKRGAVSLAMRLNRLQRKWTKPHSSWIHIVFSKS